jgi:SAM-dependent methyltransferase
MPSQDRHTPLSHDHQPLAVTDPDRLRRAREVLHQVGYTDDGVADALGTTAYLAIRTGDVPLLRRRLHHHSPIETLIRLFMLGLPMHGEAVARALQPMRVEDWLAMGLLQRVDAASVGAPVALFPFQGCVVAFDWARLRPDYVMGIAQSSITLATLTLRTHSALTLDLGTGCGLHAILAARHSDRVLAVDRNPRAINMARFNAELNGLSHIDCRTGDLFVPVETETFDLIVSNPPFVLSPESLYLFRDSGLPSDELCQRIVRQIPARLREGGYGQLLCNWAHIAGQDWRQRLAAWFEGAGCDVWIMRSQTWDPAAYAAYWIRDSGEETPAQFAEHFDAWMAYYEQERIEAISLGLITMRRASGHANWLRMDDAPDRMLGPCGNAILQGFALCDFLQAVATDEALLDTRLRLTPHVRWEQSYEPAAQGWQMLAGHLALTQGLAYTGAIDPVGVRLAILCDGRRPLRDVLVDVAASLGIDVAPITPACLGVVRKLIEQGFLLPAGMEEAAPGWDIPS